MNRLTTQHKEQTATSSGGFTIIELLIATTVFAVILLVLTAGIIQIGRVYYKGITSAQTQTTARAIIDSVKQDIQFSGGSVATVGTNAQCIGSRAYQYTLGDMFTGTNAGATVGTLSGGGCSSGMPTPISTVDKSQLLGERMRLSKFEVVSLSATMFRVSVRVISGEDDLLCSPSSAPNNCNNGTPILASDRAKPDVQCKNIRAGSQYCAVSELSTVVERRISS